MTSPACFFDAGAGVGLISSKVVNKAGQIVISQQFLDRVGSGIKGDEVLFQQLKGQIDTEVDAYALNQALVSARSRQQWHVLVL
jgi:hypothetical protein